MLNIRHTPEQGRFAAELEGYGLELDYQIHGERLIFNHTGTDPALRGRGLAGEMVEHGLAWAAAQELQVVPACSYVEAHIARHKRWQRLLETAPVQRVLNFWFGAVGSAGDGQVRSEWFKKDETFDTEIRTRFGPVIEQALTSELSAWPATPLGRLALVIVLDQFTRNSFRGTAKAFAGDPQALAIATQALDSHARYEPLQRWFLLMPLEHAEDLTVQQRCVREFETLAAEDARLAGALDYSRRHLDVIERFGRFPHRNVALGRESTPEEKNYLAQPGSGF